MFNEVGKELKRWAEVITVILTIPSVLLGIAIFTVCLTLFEKGFLGFVVGALVGGLGFFFARLACILLYAYGELVDKITAIDETVSGKNGKNTKKAVKVKSNAEQFGENGQLIKSNKDGSWDCPFCDHHNVPGAQWCENCGVQENDE